MKMSRTISSRGNNTHQNRAAAAMNAMKMTTTAMIASPKSRPPPPPPPPPEPDSATSPPLTAPSTTSPASGPRFLRWLRQPPKRRASTRQRGSQTTRTLHRVSSGAVTVIGLTTTRYLSSQNPVDLSAAATASAGTSPNAWSPTGETVLDVPAKLSARARVFSTGQGRKTDPVDAHSVAVVALRTSGLRQVQIDDTTVALRLLVDRRDQLGHARTEVVSRLHHLLLELVPGGAKKFLSAQQARALLNTVRPRDVVGKTAAGWPRN